MRVNSIIFSRVALIAVSVLVLAVPAAQALMYAPGATLNPACGPTDPNCGVTTTVGSISPGTAGQVPYYASNGNLISPSSGFTILPNGNVGIGTPTPEGKLSVFDGASQRLLVTPAGALLVGTVANSGPPGPFAQSSIAYSPSTLTGAATSLTLGDDVFSGAIPLPFTFSFYGTEYSNVYICSDGYVSFTGDNCTWNVQTIPDVGTPNGLAGFWADLDQTTSGVIRYETLGTAPNRVFVADFVNVPEYNNPSVTSTFQIKLFETSNNIELHAGSLNYVGTPLTEGVESPDGTVALAVSGRNSIPAPFSLTNDAVRFARGSSELFGAGEFAIQNKAYFGGNVGIGTTTPGSLFSIEGVANFTTGTTTFYGNGINIPANGCYAVNGVCLTSGVNFWTNSGASTYLSTGTNVGIGTSNPTSKLVVVGDIVNIGSIQGGGLSLSKGGTFAAKADYTTGLGPRKVLIGDFNGDGKADLVALNGDAGTASVFLNNGNGTFAAKVDYTVGSSPFAAAIGDLNGDGKTDIVAGNAGSGSISVLMNNGDGTFAAKVDYPAGFPTGMAIGDLNGDGVADIAVTSLFGPTAVSVYLNNGNGTFGSAANYVTGAGPFGVAIGDFNGDGKADLAVANSSSGNVSVFLNNGNGTFAAKVDYSTNAGPQAVAAGDLNGDGKTDIVSTSIFAVASVLLNNGDGTFATKVDYGTGLFPSDVAIGDLNGDGKADVVSANQSGNSVSVLLNSPTPLFYASASTGNIGIGTTTPAQKLEVTGTIRQGGCKTAGTLSANAAGDIICTPSSLRFKDNIESIGAGLSEIVQLRPVSFSYKSELDMGSSTRYGFIAEEVASVTPAFATYDAEGAPYGLDTNAILAASVNAIKTLTAEVQRLGGNVVNTSGAFASIVAASVGQYSNVFFSDVVTKVEGGVAFMKGLVVDALTVGSSAKPEGITIFDKVTNEPRCITSENGVLVNAAGDCNSQSSPLPNPAPTASTTEPAAAPIVITDVSTTTPEATSTPLLPNTGAPEVPPPPLFERTLEIGSSGADVTALQILLMQKGYLFIPPQMTLGYFGELTRSAVMKYQTSVGLQPTGAVDLATKAKLNAELLK